MRSIGPLTLTVGTDLTVQTTLGAGSQHPIAVDIFNLSGLLVNVQIGTGHFLLQPFSAQYVPLDFTDSSFLVAPIQAIASTPSSLLVVNVYLNGDKIPVLANSHSPRSLTPPAVTSSIQSGAVVGLEAGTVVGLTAGSMVALDSPTTVGLTAGTAVVATPSAAGSTHSASTAIAAGGGSTSVAVAGYSGAAPLLLSFDIAGQITKASLGVSLVALTLADALGKVYSTLFMGSTTTQPGTAHSFGAFNAPVPLPSNNAGNLTLQASQSGAASAYNIAATITALGF